MPRIMPVGSMRSPGMPKANVPRRALVAPKTSPLAKALLPPPVNRQRTNSAKAAAATLLKGYGR